MTQRGFISGIALYGAIGAVAVAGALTVALMIQSSRLETCQAEFGAFKMETKRIGEAQDKANREREAQDKKLKEKTDADHRTTVARLNRDVKRLRDDHARRSLTPEAPAASRRPDLACFSRPDFDRALRDFEAEVVGLIAEGATSAVDLDAAKTWAQALPQ